MAIICTGCAASCVAALADGAGGEGMFGKEYADPTVMRPLNGFLGFLLGRYR